MLLELCLGDAYGVPYEYAPEEFVREYNDGKTYQQRGRRQVGRYSDDGQMSLAIAEHIISDEPWDKARLADRFVEVFKRDERVGYARNFYHLLKSVKDGKELLERLKPTSEKSGGAMRAPMIGIYANIDDVMERAAIQASITHDTKAGIEAAQASALAFHYFAHRLGAKADLGKFLDETLKTKGWNTAYVGAVGSFGWMSVRAAVTAVMKSSTLTEVLKNSIAFTGDVDTVAAVAMAAASECLEIDYLLDSRLINGLEAGKYGWDYLFDLDCKMGRKLNTQRTKPAVLPI